MFKLPLSAFIVLLGTLTPTFIHGFSTTLPQKHLHLAKPSLFTFSLNGWVQDGDGEWEWEEDDPHFASGGAYTPKKESSTAVLDKSSTTSAAATTTTTPSIATPQLPAGIFRPKQSLGQNYLKDGNTVAKIIRAFHQDAMLRHHNVENNDNVSNNNDNIRSIVELGPGAGALTDRLVETYGTDVLQCIEIDSRSIEILKLKHPDLQVHHADVLQINYPEMAKEQGQPLIVVGNLPYYITSQILFALADASHYGAVDCATVTMQWEVAQRMVAPTSCKDYGILSVVFQTYANVHCHFKIPPTVFYPQPKVDSALIGLHFLGPQKLRQRLAGVNPAHFRAVVTTAFRQRRKTLRNALKKLDCTNIEQLLNNDNSIPVALPQSIQDAIDAGDEFAATQPLMQDWASKRAEQLTPGQFIEVTRLLYGDGNDDNNKESGDDLGNKVWRKLKHGV